MNKMKCFLSKKMLLAVVVLLSVGYVQAQEAKDIVLLTLDKALEIALSENPTMKVAGQEIQLKKEAKKEAYGPGQLQSAPAELCAGRSQL